MKSVLPVAGIAVITLASIFGHAPDPIRGRELFLANCAACHGSWAEGDGPATAALGINAPDLTQIARRRNGHFPYDEIRGIIDQANKGLDMIEVETDQRVFPVEASCARCNHTLMDPRHVIDGQPSIRVTVSFGSKHGWLALSSLYGSYKVASEYEIHTEEVVHMFCPHCHAELIGGGPCSDCGAPMVPMIIRGGGVLQICSRRGCRGHMLDPGGVPLE